MVFTTSKQHLLVIVLEGRAEKSTSIRETFSLVNEFRFLFHIEFAKSLCLSPY
jgi:hypothetical protein